MLVEERRFAGCVECGTNWPGLKLNQDGLCRSCRTLRQHPDHPRIAQCPPCGRRNVASHLHHPATRRQHATLALDVCLDCHDELTTQQRWVWDPTWKTEAHPVRCIVQGLADLLWLWWQRSGTAEIVRIVWLSILAVFESCGLRVAIDRGK